MAARTRTRSRWDFLKDGALVIAILGWGFQYYQTNEAQKLAYKVQQITEFKTSGAELDQATVSLYDALAKSKELEDKKAKFRDIYIKHVTLAEADRELLGQKETERYLRTLSQLSDKVEDAQSAKGSGARVTAFAEVIKARRELSEVALDL